MNISFPRPLLILVFGLISASVLIYLFQSREFLNSRPVVVVGPPINSSQFDCPRCNVFFLNIELLRADKTGLIGNTSFTPSIDKFFNKGLIFHDVSAPAGETFMSNTAVQTGIHPERLGIIGMDIDRLERMAPERRAKIKAILTQEPSWAQILQRYGYHTIGINQGGRGGSGAFLDRGFDDYTQWPNEILVEDLVALLLRKLTEAGDGPIYALFRPTFLHNWQYRAPSVPKRLIKLNTFREKYIYKTPQNSFKEGFHLKRNMQVSQAAQKRMERQIYRAQLEYGDRVLETLFRVLDTKFSRNSIIVLYANHGSGLGDNDKFEHGTSFQSNIHVPIFIKHPNFSSAVHIYEPLALFDLVPSISKMIGINEATWSMIETFDKTILRGGLKKMYPIYGRSAFDEYVRYGNWKLKTDFARTHLLTNLDQDPNEEHNLYLDRPDKAIQLELLLTSFKKRMRQEYGTPETP